MKVYIGRVVSEEFVMSTLYEDIAHADVEVEMDDKEYFELTRNKEIYYEGERKLMDLYEKAMAKQESNA